MSAEASPTGKTAEPLVGEASKAFFAKCKEVSCGHVWPAAYYPLELSKFASIIKRAICPKCGSRKAVIPKQSNGVLMEENDGA